MKKLFVFFIFFFISFNLANAQCEQCSENFKPYAKTLTKKLTSSNCIETPTDFWKEKYVFIKNTRIFRDLIFLYVNTPGVEGKKSILPTFKKNLNNLMMNCKSESQLNYLKFLLPNEFRQDVEKEIKKRNYNSWDGLDNLNNEYPDLDFVIYIRLI